MGRRGQLSLATVGLAVAGLVLSAVPVDANVFGSDTDLPEGTPSDPAASTPADTTAVVEYLASSDVDAFAVCITDAEAFQLSVHGVDTAGAPRMMDTVVWLFDADGYLVASNDDISSSDWGSALAPGSAAASAPGPHVVAFAPFRSTPLDPAGENMTAAGSGPVTSWRHGSTTAPGLVRVDLLAGASGSVGCGGDAGSEEVPSDATGVVTGSGRCQALGGKAAPAGKAVGLDRAAESRQNQYC